MAWSLGCPKCRKTLPEKTLAEDGDTFCPVCLTDLHILVFPAAFTPTGVAVAAGVTGDSEATCFFHAMNRAVAVCAGCGRLLCSVCEVDFAGQKLCPACIASGSGRGPVKRPENNRVLYDTIALTLAVGFLFIPPIICVTGPSAIVYSIWAWKKPSGIMRRNRWRLWVAVGISSIGIVFWIFIFGGLLKALGR
jgi:hypothetical protein